MINPVQTALKKIANSKPAVKHINKCIENPQFLTATLLATSVSKDVFAYALRVKNTLNNDEIPKDKKSFVAKMDAATGVVTAVVQMGTGLLLANKKIQGAICKKLFGELGENTKKFKQASSGFAMVSTLIGATLFAKRILVPLISTPIAEHMENNYNQNTSQKGNSN